MAVGWKLFWPVSIVIGSVIGWAKAYWASKAQEKLQYIMTAALIISVAVSGSQTSLLRGQIELENRPYLYVDIQPAVSEKPEKQRDGTEYWNLYLGAKLVYKNVGKTPASNVQTEIHMYNNADKVDDAKRLEEWYVKLFGYFPKPTAIFPEQTGQEVGLFVDAGEGATEYLITVRVSYSGEDPAKTYWYSADVRYAIEKDSRREIRMLTEENGQVIQKPRRREYGVWLLETNTDYDAVGNRQMPLAFSNPYTTS